MKINWDDIRREFETTDITLAELAEKHGIKYPTVKSRKQRQGWSKDASDGKKDASSDVGDASATHSTGSPNVDVQEKTMDIEDATENVDLTTKQRLFIYEYTIDFNGTQAAIRAGYSKDTAAEQASRLLKNVKVSAAVEKLISQRIVTLDVRANDIIEQYKKIAFANLKDFITWRSDRFVVGEDEQTGEKINDIVTRIELRPSDEVDGTVIAEVSETPGKYGPSHSIKLNDRMKALDALSKHINLFEDRGKRRMDEMKLQIELEKAQLAREKLSLEKERLEIEKKKLDPPTDDAHEQNSGYEDALNAQAEDVFADEVEDGKED